jgi:hypothetical protein
MAEKNYPVRAFATDNTVTLQFEQGVTANDLQRFASTMKSMFEGMQAKIDNDNQKTIKEVKNVKKLVEHKSITPEKLAALNSLVGEKAKLYVEKLDGIQIDMSVFEGSETPKTISVDKLIRKETGRVKQRIWIDLNKKCLERKGTAPKNRIKDIEVEKAFDFVRTWGGFTI